MPIYPSNSEPIPEFITVRVIVEALKLSRNNTPVTLNEIAEKAGTTRAYARRVLEDERDIWDENSTLLMSSSARFRLSVRAVRLGGTLLVARALSWQEFESFAEECLQTSGFLTQKGVIVKDSSRRWQVDVIATKDRMVLGVDCKHWESPGYESRLRKAAVHQKLALQAHLRRTIAKEEQRREILALPIILTLFQPRSRIVDGVVVVSVEQLADFLERLSPYSSEMPFTSVQEAAKSSIS